MSAPDQRAGSPELLVDAPDAPPAVPTPTTSRKSRSREMVTLYQEHIRALEASLEHAQKLNLEQAQVIDQIVSLFPDVMPPLTV